MSAFSNSEMIDREAGWFTTELSPTREAGRRGRPHHIARASNLQRRGDHP
jgi:hypothetical protein